MSSRPSTNKRAKSHQPAPVLGQVPSQRIPVIDGRCRSTYGYFNTQVQRTPRYAETTNLFQAILQYNDPKMVQCCLDKGADVNLQDEEGKTPLMACIHKHPKICQLLIEKGADVFVQDYKGNTALFYAVKYEDFSFAETLLAESNGRLVDFINQDGKTPLMVLANEHWNLDEGQSVRWLLEHGSDVNHKDKSGNTALTLTLCGIEKGHRYDENAASFIQILLETGQAKVTPSEVALAHDIDRREGRRGYPIPQVIKLLEEHVFTYVTEK